MTRLILRSHTPRTTPLLLAALSAGAACYGSELEGKAPEVSTEPDVTEVRDGADGTEVTTAPEVTNEVDGTDAREVDSVGPPPAWESLSLGDAGAIGDVIVVREDLAFAVSGARVLRWNGATWLAYGEPGGALALHGVWADVDGSVVVVGAEGLVARRAGTGGDWQKVEAGTTVDLWDVDGRDADDVWVVGDLGEVRHWNGTAWEQAFTKDTVNLRSLWVDRDKAGPEGVLAVGTGGQLVSFVVPDGGGEGSFKAAQIAGGSVVLHDVVAFPDGTMLAVGTGHTITGRRPADVTWRGQSTNDGAERDVLALAVTPDGKVRALGADGLVLIQEGSPDRRTWSVVTAAQAAAGLQDLAAAAVFPGDEPRFIALATDGGGVAFEDGAWKAIATRPEAAVKDLAAAPDGTLWAAGSAGLFMHRGADGWSAEPLPDSVATVDLEAVAVAADGDVYAVGAGGVIVKKVDGAAVVTVASPVPLDLFGVTVTATGVAACGRGGTLVVLDGNDASSIRASGSTADLRAIEVGGDGALWIAGAFGTLLRAEGSSLPVPVTSGVGGSLNDLAPTADGVLVVGDNGVVLAADQDGATLLNESPGVFLQGAAVAGENRFAAGWNGVVMRADGATWVTEESGTNLILEAIWVSASEAVAAGRQGILLRRLEAP